LSQGWGWARSAVETIGDGLSTAGDAIGDGLTTAGQAVGGFVVGLATAGFLFEMFEYMSNDPIL
jgi:hypothetical protein